MKFEKLNDSKIRIFIPNDDINFSANMFFSNSNVSQEVIQSILNKAKKSIGFETGDSELLVEAISSDSNFIITITKLTIYNNHDMFSSNLIFKFDNIDAFLDFKDSLICFKNFKYGFETCSLILYNNYLYLYIFDSNIPSSFISLLSEFATQIEYSDKFDGILHEYGRVLSNKIENGIFFRYHFLI